MLREACASGLLLLVVSALLWAPTATAVAPEESLELDGPGLRVDPGTTAPTADLGEGLTWFVPEQVQVGHPVHAAVAVLTGEGLATSMHQDLSIWVTLEDEILLHTPNVHEHQGLHLVTVTPQKPGTLKFWADDGSGGHEDHLLGPLAAPSRSLPEPSGMVAEVAVVGEPDLSALTRLDPRLVVDGPSWALVSENESVPYSSLLMINDEAGRLVLGGWPDPKLERSAMTGQVPQSFHGQALLTPHPGSDVTPFAQTVEVTAEAMNNPYLVFSGFPSPEYHQLPPCAEAPGRLVVDPNSVLMNEDVRGYQEWSDIRVHYLDPEHLGDPEPPAVQYWFFQWPVHSPGSGLANFLIKTDHPFAYAAMRPPGPGNFLLAVSQQAGDGFDPVCVEHLRILPEPAALDGPGELAVDIEVDGDLLAVDLRSERDGEALPHYEFDVQVVRLEDDQPAALAWRGKLHGHAGEVSFLMSSLAPGDYEMRVHPSPQDPGIAPLAAGPDGFVYPFKVEGVRMVEFEKIGAEAEALPLPVGLMFIAVAGLVALVALYRRRS